MTISERTIPQAFIWRRLHSIAGFGLVVFLIFHLLTNSMAALYIGDDGKNFIESVNAIHETPYLQVIEIFVLALPILIHMLWGIKYLHTSAMNSFPTDGTRPALPQYPRNQAYTWQRITSWFLVIGIIAHVIHMRFIEAPLYTSSGTEKAYVIRISDDEGLPLVAERLGVRLYDADQLAKMKNDFKLQGRNDAHSSPLQEQKEHEHEAWFNTLEKLPLKNSEIIAVANNFGTAELLVVRDTFKMPSMMALYTIFVLASTFHAFNGMWTFMISWGVTLTQRSQQLMSYLTLSLMAIVTFLGLSAIWLTYWINLKT